VLSGSTSVGLGRAARHPRERHSRRPARGGRRDPYGRNLSDLVGELSTRNETFRTVWAAHNVRRHDTGVRAFTTHSSAKVIFSHESMELLADPGLTMFVYTAEPARNPSKR
jgi:hypothetical protein